MTNHRNIYVVDDDRSVRISLFYALTPLAYKVRSLSSGRELVDAAASLEPGCVLLDLQMPDLDGLQVIKALGDRIAVLPVIVMTGHADINIAVSAMRLGASDFIEKPFEKAAMTDAVARVFRDLDRRTIDVGSRLAAERRIDALTRREREVLDALATGLPNKIIAFRLGLSVRTVEMYRSSMMQRLGVRSLPEALHLNFLATGKDNADGAPGDAAAVPEIALRRSAVAFSARGGAKPSPASRLHR